MKIVFVASSMHRDGAERVISILCNDWAKKGHDITLILTQTEAISGYPLDERVRFLSIIHQLKGKHPHWGIIKNIRIFCLEERPDCVISFNNDVCALAALALIGTKIPLIYSERNDPNKTNQRKIDKLYRKIVERRSRGVVFQTDGAKACYSKRVQAKSTVIVNPLDLSGIPARKENKNEKFLISVGRLTPQKRHDVSIKAFSLIADSFPEYNFKIFGIGELEKEIKSIIQAYGLDSRIELCGSDPNVLQAVAGASLFILASDYEGIPNVLVEAMAIGLPCISTDCSPGGARMFLHHGENGILVPCGDVQKMSAAMRELLNDRSLANRLGEHALSIRDLVNIDHISDEWLAFLKKFI